MNTRVVTFLGCNLILAGVALATPLPPGASVYAYQLGIPGRGLGVGEPGTHFDLDYATWLESPHHVNPPYPYVATYVLFMFDAKTDYNSLHIQLDCDPTIFTFPRYTPSTQIAYMLYDPDVWGDPIVNCPTRVLPQEWETELQDGYLSGRLWLDSATSPTDAYILVASVAYITGISPIPEPGTLALLAAGMTLALRRPRRH